MAFGFTSYEKNLQHMKTVVCQPKYAFVQRTFWRGIKKAMIANRDALITTPEWKHIKWIEGTPFEHPDRIMMPLISRIKNERSIRSKLAQFKWYQKMHAIKVKLYGK